MNNHECFYRVSAKALIFDDQGRFLLTKDKNGIRDFLGGGIDHDEHPRDAMKREIYEETGLKVSGIDNLPSYFLTAKRVHTNSYFANVFYKVQLKDYDFTPSDECIDLKFFSPDDVDGKSIYFTVRQFVQEYH